MGTGPSLDPAFHVLAEVETKQATCEYGATDELVLRVGGLGRVRFSAP